MVNLNHLRRLIRDIYQQEQGPIGIYAFLEKVGVDLWDIPTSSSIDTYLASKDETGLITLAKQVLQAYPSATASKLLRACLNENAISPETRTKLIEEMILLGSLDRLSGKLNLVEFLQRIWNLDAMESTDSRFRTASGDIYQHMINNDDWSDSYLLYEYLSLDTDSDQVFAKFCEEAVHPMVRANKDEQALYVKTINKHLSKHNLHLAIDDEIAGYSIYKCIEIRSGGVKNKPKNLIFASCGPKPEIVLNDAINNDIVIVKNEQFCLIYDAPIPASGLSLQHLIDWWKSLPKPNASLRLYERLKQSLDSEPEKLLFDAYYAFTKEISNDKLPALIPQVYLHYDPYTLKQLDGKHRLPRQRMDFLILFSEHHRVVIEVDGKQHYSDPGGDKASPAKYAEMVAADRELKLYGYEVFRFGGYELQPPNGSALAQDFFRRLLRRYNVVLS